MSSCFLPVLYETVQNSHIFLPPYLCPLLPPRSYRTTLCLQYPAEKIALAAIWVNNEMNKAQFGTGLENVSAYAKHINNGSGFILG